MGELLGNERLHPMETAFVSRRVKSIDTKRGLLYDPKWKRIYDSKRRLIYDLAAAKVLDPKRRMEFDATQWVALDPTVFGRHSEAEEALMYAAAFGRSSEKLQAGKALEEIRALRGFKWKMPVTAIPARDGTREKKAKAKKKSRR